MVSRSEVYEKNRIGLGGCMLTWVPVIESNIPADFIVTMFCTMTTPDLSEGGSVPDVLLGGAGEGHKC